MNPTVLVVDDIASVRLYHMSLLRRKGYECVAAGDGVEALEKLRGQPVHLVLLDLSMPKMGGEEFIRRVRAQPDLAMLPILVITSESATSGGSRSEWGRVGVLYKPLTPVTLLQGVQRLLPAGEASLAGADRSGGRPEHGAK
jgi:CheY-like chemotaxis protein